MAPVLFAVDGDDFINADYGVFVTNATKDQQKLDTFKQLMQAAIQNEKIALSSVVDVLNSDSLSDIKVALVQAEDQVQQAQQQASEQEHQHAVEIEQYKMGMDEKKMQQESEEKQLDREKDIAVATLKSQGAAELKAGDQGVKALADQEKLALEKSKLDYQKVLDHRKLELEHKKVDAENLRSKQELDKQHQHEKTENAKERENKIKVVKARPKPSSKK